MDKQSLASFLVLAKRKTYAGHGSEVKACRLKSHDLEYQEGGLYYYDTYLGSTNFIGEEAVWEHGKPIWGMNYTGRQTKEPFSGDFLKEALSEVPLEMPVRGPQYYQNGGYVYRCRIDGDLE